MVRRDDLLRARPRRRSPTGSRRKDRAFAVHAAYSSLGKPRARRALPSSMRLWQTALVAAPLRVVKHGNQKRRMGGLDHPAHDELVAIVLHEAIEPHEF